MKYEFNPNSQSLKCFIQKYKLFFSETALGNLNKNEIMFLLIYNLYMQQIQSQ